MGRGKNKKKQKIECTALTSSARLLNRVLGLDRVSFLRYIHGEGAGRSEARGGGREGGGGSESGSEGEDESDSESDSEHESGDEGHASLPHVSRVREVASQILPLMESEGLQLADDAEREEKLQEKTGQRGMGAGEMGGSSEAVGGCRMK